VLRHHPPLHELRKGRQGSEPAFRQENNFSENHIHFPTYEDIPFISWWDFVCLDIELIRLMMKRNLKYSPTLLLLLICSLQYSCNIFNPILSSYADAGDDLSSYVGSYVTLDASNSQIKNNVYYIRWYQNQNNPDSVTLLGVSDYYPINNIVFYVEGAYEFYLEIEDMQGEIYMDTLVVKVAQRQYCLIDDIALEGMIRFTLKYPEGPLNEVKLTELDSLQNNYINSDKIENFEGIQFCTELSYLHLLGLKVTDISPISSLTKLKNFDYNQSHCLENITPLSGLTSLEYLVLHSNNISNIEPLRHLINLKELDLDVNPITDISPLEGLYNLEILHMCSAGPYANKLSDISSLSSLTALKELRLPYQDISDISPLNNLTRLERLYLYSNNITDISSVADLDSLNYLNVKSNSIQSLNGISNLDGLTSLSASSNLISDISDLEFTRNLKSYGLSNNNITNIEPLIKNPHIGDGCSIFLDNNPLDSISINLYIPTLQDRGARVFI
jgi:Leucine-rich repeat (LRR) protein